MLYYDLSQTTLKTTKGGARLGGTGAVMDTPNVNLGGVRNDETLLY